MDDTVGTPTVAGGTSIGGPPPPAASDRASDVQPTAEPLGSAAMDIVQAWHHRMQPHLDHLARIVDQFEAFEGERLGGMLHAALDCTDDDLLPLIVESEAVLYPAVERTSRDGGGARRMLRVDERVITELRHELRGRLAGDLDDGTRVAIRERLYALHLLLRSHVVKHDELLAAALTGLDEHEDEARGLNLGAARPVTTTCSGGDGACGCGHGAVADGESD